METAKKLIEALEKLKPWEIEEIEYIEDQLEMLGYVMGDMGRWYDPNSENHLDELEFEYGHLYAYNNHDYRCELSYELSCGYCPPNRGENQSYRNSRNRLRGRPKPEWDNPGQPESKRIAKDRNKGRKFKRVQVELQLSEDEDI